MKKISLILLAMFLINLPALAQDTAPEDNGTVVVEPAIVGKLRSVNILIHSSSVVKRIEVSGNDVAVGLLNESRELYKEAQDQHQAGNDEEAMKILNQSVAKLMQASREAKTSLDDVAHQTRMYQDRLASVQSLLSAHHRLAMEKGVVTEKAPIEEQVKKLIAQSEVEVQQQKVPEGQILLNEGYQVLKVSIFSMHNGDTVNSSRKFETLEEHYLYEVDRNQSYRMLIFMLIRGVTPRTLEQIQRLVNTGDELAKQADAQAQAGEYKSAIATIISSSRYYARAIQVGGVYIPE